MERLYIFAIRNDVWIYILCFLGLLWYLSEFYRANRNVRRAMFGLERETGIRARNSALMFILVFGGIALFVAYVNFQVAPGLAPELLRPPTPTPDPFSLPAQVTVAPGTQPDAPSPTPPLVATVTLRGDTLIASPEIPTAQPGDGAAPTGRATLALPTQSVPVAGCSPTVAITDPRDGDAVVGTISIFGSANIPGFAYYQIEISGPQTNERWASLLGRNVSQPVEDGLLATADLSAWVPGTYQLRLLTVNSAGAVTNQCELTFDVQSP